MGKGEKKITYVGDTDGHPPGKHGWPTGDTGFSGHKLTWEFVYTCSCLWKILAESRGHCSCQLFVTILAAGPSPPSQSISEGPKCGHNTPGEDTPGFYINGRDSFFLSYDTRLAAGQSDMGAQLTSLEMITPRSLMVLGHLHWGCRHGVQSQKVT